MTEGTGGKAMRTAAVALLAALLAGPLRPATAEQVAPGVIYNVHAAPGPNVVHVVGVDRLRSEYKFEVGWPQHKRNFTAKARTSVMAGLYDSPPGHDVLVATNGAFYDPVNLPNIIGSAAGGGEILEPPDVHDDNTDTLFFGPSRMPAIVSNVGHAVGTLTFANGASITLDDYNVSPPGVNMIVNKITAYTPNWDATTGSAFINLVGAEVILTNVNYPMRGDKEISGIVSAIKTGAASSNNAIPAGGMVLTVWGIPRSTVLANTAVGDRLRMRFSSSTTEYNNADFAITGIGWIVRNGAANIANWNARPSGSPYSRDPMTVLGWSATHMYMVVCDGRSGASVGMTFQEMTDFLTGQLGVTEAINLDGGGSSTMWINGSVRNVPSDGSERAVANSVLLVRQDTATAWPFSDPFAPGGRLGVWDDKFTWNGLVSLAPAAPGGDGTVIRVMNRSGGVETTRAGDFADADYAVQSYVYCEHRPDVAADGFERYALFARDSGTGALGLPSYGGGNCYALTYDSHDGRLRAGKYVNGTLSDFLEAAPVYSPSTAWRLMRIECAGNTIRYLVDGSPIAEVTDSTFVRGFYGLGCHEFFNTNANMHGTRADQFSGERLASPPGQAADPFPAHAATKAPIRPVLTWTAGADATSHLVHFGTTSPGAPQGTFTSPQFTPGLLATKTTYYWRVDEVNAAGTTLGEVWSFTTGAIRGDFNNDLDVDQEDFGQFQACLTGELNPQFIPACAPARLDVDTDVDGGDVSLFIECFGPPGSPAPINCEP